MRSPPPTQPCRPAMADVLGDRGSDSTGAVIAQGHPYLQPPEAAAELETVVPEGKGLCLLVCPGLARSRRCSRRTRSPSCSGSRSEQRAAVDRYVQPLVRVEGQRIRALHAREQVTTVRVRGRGRAVGAVDVEPEVELPRRRSAIASSRSTAPVAVVPPVPTTQNGFETCATVLRYRFAQPVSIEWSGPSGSPSTRREAARRAPPPPLRSRSGPPRTRRPSAADDPASGSVLVRRAASRRPMRLAV